MMTTEERREAGTLWDVVKDVDNRVTLWFRYGDIYHELLENDKARTALAKDPGVKFMRRGKYVVGLIIFIVYMIGRCG